MNAELTELVFILDRSGSMNGLENDTIGGFNGMQKAFSACVRGVRRGDVYYADFGSIEDAVGHELAKKRLVLIIQNNFGNKKSTTTICLCLTTKCKYGLQYHVHFNDLNIVSRESDICAEQIKRLTKADWNNIWEMLEVQLWKRLIKHL